MPPPKRPFKKPFRPQIPQPTEEEEERRLRTPRNTEILGIVEQRLGASKMRVRCFDSKERITRIPGRLKRKLWVREGDVVLVEPWEFGGDEKGDIIFKYKPVQVKILKQRGLLGSMEEFEEF